MKLTAICSVLCFAMLVQCATSARAAALAFVGLNADGTDGYSIVALGHMPAGTTVNFTDDEWTGSAFLDSNEADWSWTTSSTVAAGTVINFTDINDLYSTTASASASTGTITPNSDSSDNPGFSNSGEVVYAYTGTRALPTFLALISSASPGSADFASLSGGQAVQLSVSSDGAKYVGPRDSEQQFSGYLPLIADVANNWSDVGNGTGDNDFDPSPFTIPEPSTCALVVLTLLLTTVRRK